MLATDKELSSCEASAGVCTLEEHGGDGAKLWVFVEERPYRAKLWTARDFGCVLWEGEPCPECKGAGGFYDGGHYGDGTGWGSVRGCPSCQGTKVKGGRIEVR